MEWISASKMNEEHGFVFTFWILDLLLKAMD